MQCTLSKQNHRAYHLKVREGRGKTDALKAINSTQVDLEKKKKKKNQKVQWSILPGLQR